MAKIYIAYYSCITPIGVRDEWAIEPSVAHASKTEAVKVAKAFYEKLKNYNIDNNNEEATFFEDDEEGLYEIQYKNGGDVQSWFVKELEVKE